MTYRLQNAGLWLLITLSLIISTFLSCGREPKDQCIGKGTECHGNEETDTSDGQESGNGHVGPAGPVGPNGTPGAQGQPGSSGASGTPGTNGSSCTVIQGTNEATISCTDGTTATITSGTNGTNGTPGTVITSVQFCPGSVATYPSTFPEVGFLIDGKLYAVYSANGGFMSELPPGNYYSNAIGSSCNFKVNQDRTISPL